MVINREIRDPISIRGRSTARQLAMYTILHKCVDIFLIVIHVKMSHEIVEIELRFVQITLD